MRNWSPGRGWIRKGNNKMAMDLDEMILRFFRNDIGRILITDEDGKVLYEDAKAASVRQGKTNWKAACPPPTYGQRAEMWDLLDTGSGKTWVVYSSTFREDGRLRQIHHLMDTSLYMDLVRDMGEYSKSLKNEKDHDGLTGLYNKSRFLELKKTLFRNQKTIAVFNMDVNNLKQMNDVHGHEAGDRLLLKAAESLKKIEARNIILFRVGGDEFIVVAIHVNREEAERILKTWEEGLAELNRQDDGIRCEIACGFAFGGEDYDLDEIFQNADEKMYEDKKAHKGEGNVR